MAGRLEGKVALVTGGTRGIGYAIAEAFAREGATTIVASRKPDAVAAAVAALREATGGVVHGVPLHVGEIAALGEAIEALTQAHGLIDVLVNNAATNPFFGTMIDTPASAFRKTFEVNVEGSYTLACEVAKRLLAANRPGSLIQLSSILGQRSAPMQGVYGMTKAALISMSQTLAVELGPAGIRVNCIAPGLVETKFASVLVETPELRTMFEAHTALGHIAQPHHIAGAAVFLASDESAYVTGAVLPVDGGYLVR